MAKLLADEDFPYGITLRLRSIAHDVVTVHELGLANQKTQDPVILNVAHSESRIILTKNRWDFIALHRAGMPHSGIIVCTQDGDLERQTSVIGEALASHEDLSGKLVRVNRGGWSVDGL